MVFDPADAMNARKTSSFTSPQPIPPRIWDTTTKTSSGEMVKKHEKHHISVLFGK
jgi:hypothetical protein